MTGDHGQDDHWSAYHSAQADRPVHRLCRDVIDLAGAGNGRTAIDLGCGLGRETDALLTAGWRVHAVDHDPRTPDRVLSTVDRALVGSVTVEVIGFEEISELPPANVIYAGYSLPFTRPAAFPAFWSVIRASLLPGAWIGVTFFGVRDSWSANTRLTFQTAREVQALADGLQIAAITETIEDGTSMSGPKRWHLIDLIARRPEPVTGDGDGLAAVVACPDHT